MDLFVVNVGYEYKGFLTQKEAFAFVEGKDDWSIKHYVLVEPSPLVVLWAMNTLLDNLGSASWDYSYIVAQCYLADSDGYRYEGIK